MEKEEKDTRFISGSLLVCIALALQKADKPMAIHSQAFVNACAHTHTKQVNFTSKACILLSSILYSPLSEFSLNKSSNLVLCTSCIPNSSAILHIKKVFKKCACTNNAVLVIGDFHLNLLYFC